MCRVAVPGLSEAAMIEMDVRKVALLLGLFLAAGVSAASPPKSRLRYDLRPGDHLIYRQTLERRIRSSDSGFATPESTSRLSWTNHVLVLGETEAGRVVGFSRNRQSAELLAYRENGRNRLKRERLRFEQSWAEVRGSSVEANIVSTDGRGSLPWRSHRERISEVLVGLHEIEPLPQREVGPGDAWSGTYPLGLTFQATAWERVNDEDCLRVAGSSATQDFRMSYRFCPASGVLESAAFEGSYFGIRARVHERWNIELVRVERNEEITDWLSRPDLRLATLAAMMVGEEVSVDTRTLYDLLALDDPEVQRQVLALAYRRDLPPAGVEILESLLTSDDARVRVLTVRLLARIDGDHARSLIERARDDPDAFVRSAAGPRAASMARDDLLTADDSGDGPSLATLPAWVCADSSGWSERIRPRLRFAPQIPGTTWRRMSAPGLGGWGYSVYVPEDYRGDEPFPLLIYLAGGHGRPLLGISGAQTEIERQGYLVLFPQADGYWWTAHSTEIVSALVDETLRRFNVDTNRVYLSGFSNGGTGTLHFATLWPRRLAAISSLMGAGAFLPEGQSPMLLNAGALPGQWIHGKRDAVIPWQSTRDTLRRLVQVAPDATIETHYLSKRDHDLWLGSDNGLVFGFFEQQRRNPFPKAVALQLRDLAFPRRYWIEVLQKEPGIAEVRAVIEPDNTIVLRTRRVQKLRLLLRRDLLPAPDDELRVVFDGKTVFRGPLRADCELIRESWSETADPFLAHSMELTVQVQP